MMAPEVAVGTRIVLPALTDTHVHFREPGLTHKATIYSESRAALAGGITGFLDMPNTKPPTVSAAALTAKYALGAATAQANYGFFPAASAETPELLRTVPRHRIPGIKLFLGTTTGAMAAPEQPVLEEIFRMCAAMDLPVMVHAEDDALIAAQNAVVAAQSLGLGSCYIGDIMEQYEEHRRLLKLPAWVFPACMLVLGWPTRQQRERPKPARFAQKHIVHENAYRRMAGPELREMFAGRTGGQSFEAWMSAFCRRKYDSDFAREMSRSVEEYLRDFEEEES